MSSELTLFATLFARLLGFFLLSPLFSGRGIPLWVRFGVTLSCSLLLLPPLFGQVNLTLDHPLLFATHMLKEVALGYLLGFLFSLLFEAAAFAGQMVGTLTGFSATEILDPLSNSASPLISRFFSLTLFALFLSLDLHHPLLLFLSDSFTTFPSTAGIVDATTRMFHYALSFALFPLTSLLVVILCFAVVARFFPTLQIFWIGFPIQLLVGFGVLGLTLPFFTQILAGAFNELWALAKSLFL